MRTTAGIVLVIHAILLSWLVCVHSPLVDEPAHLASGLHHWHTFSFDLYRVNPPLVRSVAALPLLISQLKVNWDAHSDAPYSRAEFPVGADFFEANENAHLHLFAGRFFCIPFCLLGGLICYLWGNELYGKSAGFMALILWCFSPMILAFGYTIMPDVAAASMGLLASYVFWKWLKSPTMKATILTGVVLGIAELTKFTLLALYPIFFVVWLINVIVTRHDEAVKNRKSLQKLMLLFLVSVFTINFGYGYEGSFIPLRDYEFVSRTLAADTKWNHEKGFTVTGNRFRNTLPGIVPVPLPFNYVMGMDVQKYDFEIGRNSYFLGQWSRKGWHTYYILGLFFKTPLAVTVLCVMSLIAFALSKKYRIDLASEMLLFLPIITILSLASMQTKMNEHLRYIIPVLPFVYVSVSRVTISTSNSFGKIKCVLATLVILATVSSLSWFPHSTSYLNELICNPWNGRYFTQKNPPPLLGSNIDWGQNLYFLKKWHDKNHDKAPLIIDYACIQSPERLGMKSVSSPQDRPPGYYAIGINELFASDGKYKDLQSKKPVQLIAYSIYIYHLTHNDIDMLQQKRDDAIKEKSDRNETKK